MIGERFGRFRIVAPLGKGGMATVWRAEDSLLGRDVALKLIRDELTQSATARARFLAEAENGRRLDHPCVVPVLDAGEAQGRLWIALALVDGETLADRIARAPVPAADAARILASAAEGIAHAHSRGVLHRDVTSRNIMVGRDGRVFVLDFGLSRALDADSLTTSGAVMGTIAYLSPEVARGGRATAASDVWGLGVVTYETLTGMPPFRADQNAALIYAILNQTPAPPSAHRAGLPAPWDALVQATLSREATERPAIAALIERLRALTEPAGVPRTESGATTIEIPRRGPAAREVSRIFLAVLPFTDPAAEDTSLAGVGAGFSRALAAALSSRESLTVVVPEPVAGDEASLESRARSLGANRVLLGDVRRSGASLRVTWQLTDPFSNVQVAGGSVDGLLVDLFALEDRLIASVEHGLGLGADSRAATREVRRDPVAVERYQQALGYLQRHDHAPSVDGAIAILERLAASDGSNAAYHATLARAYLMKKRLSYERSWESLAARACERALELDAGSPETRLALAELRLETGQPEEALSEFESLRATRPSLEAFIGAGRALEALGRVDEAERMLSDAVATYPDRWNGYQWLGLLHFHRAQHPEAIEAWQHALEHVPENARTLANLGAAYFQLGRYEDTVDACQRSLRSAPNARALANLGTALTYLGRHEEAIEAFEKAVALQPGDPATWGNLGSACRLAPGFEARGREASEKAILLQRDHLAKNPNDAKGWAMLGGWLSNLQQREPSDAAIHRALSLAPDDLDVLAAAVGVYQVWRPDRAIMLLRRALSHGYRLESFMRDPGFHPLRESAEFTKDFRDFG